MEDRDISDWVTKLVQRLEAIEDQILTVEVGGTPVVVAFSDDLKEFFIGNQALLRRIGKETFKSFLALIHEKRDEEAFLLLLQKMSVDDIIARMNQNAATLAKYNDQMEEFIAKVKKFLINSVLRIASKGLLGLIV